MKGSRRRPVVLDPFVGGGTSTTSAAMLGLPAIGIDLSPFAALLSRARVAIDANPRRVAALLVSSSTGPEHCAFSEEARGLFRSSDLGFASSVIERVRKAVPASKDGSALRSLLDDPVGKYDSEVVALTALCLAAAATAKVVRGSNPVWFRKALPGEVGRTPRLDTAAHSAARLMVDDLACLGSQVPRRRVRFLNEDFRRTSLPSDCADLILTSPPYLNRLDYVINHLAPLMILTGLLPIPIEELRRDMIGTTKMVEKGSAAKEWGKTCLAFLDVVSHHASQASATYYYWNYYKYFKDVYSCLENLKRVARPHAAGALVVQTSFYKEAAVLVPQIVVEMAANLDIDARIARTEIVRAHMGTISPRQTRYVPRKILEECVVALDFS